MKVSLNNEQTVAVEKFSPNLNEHYNQLFLDVINKIDKSLSINRIEIIKGEIERISRLEDVVNSDIERLKYIATLRVLVDLSQQGWIFVSENNKLALKMESKDIDEKQLIRYRLSAERNAQFKADSVKRFIRHMEAVKEYAGARISIRNLIGDPGFLVNRINNKQVVCEPYIQLVTNAYDELTGYKLADIWRYFRYTWSIPYKTMPGRNLYYIVRDRQQPYHPVVGIFALGNSVLNLTVRDDDIGWTVDAIKKNMLIKEKTSICDQTVSDTDGKKIKVKINTPIETEGEYKNRIETYANKIMPLLQNNIQDAIGEIYVKDLECDYQIENPSQDQIDRLNKISKEYASKSINNKNNNDSPNWEIEAKSNLFTRKRATELAKLLSATMTFNSCKGTNNVEKLNKLLSSENGRKAIHTALIANRKCKIGSNMMDIIVCGAIPPYNELLGGKLISILACSPTVIRDYTHRYSNQISEIASRMKGERVVRDSKLVYLGTTSLYSIGSSQYNRIKVPVTDTHNLEYRKMGITEGYGTVYFSKETTTLFSKILELQDGGKKIGHVFGEGTSPRFRMISRGLGLIGIRAEAFLKHYSPRIVYSINLACNANEFLMGIDDNVDYGFDLNDEKIVEQKTQELIDFWYQRWLTSRLVNVDICARLNQFNIERILLGNI